MRANIAFSNLRVEMSRLDIGVVEMARRLGWNRDTLAGTADRFCLRQRADAAAHSRDSGGVWRR